MFPKFHSTFVALVSCFFILVSSAVSAFPDEKIKDKVMYFFMPDRFADGDVSSNLGAYQPYGDEDPTSAAAIMQHGHDPSSLTTHHGGDFQGAKDKLEYIKGLGVNAVWTTPILGGGQPVMNNGNLSSGYHGYWPVDFMNVDKRLGGNQAYKDFVKAAHTHEIDVVFDFIVNHTANIISYESCAEDDCRYVSLDEVPYLDVDGNEFDPIDYEYSWSNGVAFPQMELASFPNWPEIDKANVQVKTPNWMNNPLYYHNRGERVSTTESETFGEYFNLDDLFTEHPVVLQGEIDIIKHWIDNFGVDAIRADAISHVRDAFFQQWIPAISAHARAKGKDDFFVFGENYRFTPAENSVYVKDAQLDSLIDFPFRSVTQRVLSAGAATDELRHLFAGDDYYSDSDSNAYYLATFVSNHDLGRIGAAVKHDNPAMSDDDHLRLIQLAHALLFTARGIPVVYYGDEQGFTGLGTDGMGFEAARQDMFPSQVPTFIDPDQNSLIGAKGTPADDNFNTDHPMYGYIANLADFRQQYPAMRRGAQLHRFSESRLHGVYAFSRIIHSNPVEHLVVLNSSSTEMRTVEINTLHANTEFVEILNKQLPSIKSDALGNVAIRIPPLSIAVYQAQTKLPKKNLHTTAKINLPARDFGFDQFFVGAKLDTNTLATVDFYAKSVNDTDFVYLGSDDNAPYRVLYDGSQLPVGSMVTFYCKSRDYAGNTAECGHRDIRIENRLQSVTIHYENGNERQRMFKSFASGRIGLPERISEDGHTFTWPESEKNVTLVYESGGIDGLLEFDRPVNISLTDVINHAKLIENGIESVIYINNSHEISSEINFNQQPVPTLPSNIDAARPIEYDLYVRGTVNGWGLDNPLTYVGGYQFSTEFEVSHNELLLKVADSRWSAVNVGGPFLPDAGLTQSQDPKNIPIYIPQSQLGTYHYRYFMFPALDGSANSYRFHRLSKKLALTGAIVEINGLDQQEFELNSAGQFIATANLDKGVHDVLFTDFYAEQLRFGAIAEGEVLQLNRHQPLSIDGEKLRLEIETPGDYQFIMTPYVRNAPDIQVVRVKR